MFNIFKKKKHLVYTKNLLLESNGQVFFNEEYTPIRKLEDRIFRLLKHSGICDDRLYVEIYKDYKEHYATYDMYPTLLTYRIPLHAGRLYKRLMLDNDEVFEYLIPPISSLELIPKSLRFPKTILDSLVSLYGKCRGYLPSTAPSVDQYTLLIEGGFLKEWTLISEEGFLDEFIDVQLNNMLAMSSTENRTLIKNIIHRHTEELTNKFKE